MKYPGLVGRDARLAEMLALLLQQSGHVTDPPATVDALLDAASHAVSAGAPRPVIVVEMCGGAIMNASGSHAADLIFLDEDSEGRDSDRVINTLGDEYYVTEMETTSGPSGAALVAQVQGDLAAAQADSDSDRQTAPRG